MIRFRLILTFKLIRDRVFVCLLMYQTMDDMEWPNNGSKDITK